MPVRPGRMGLLASAVTRVVVDGAAAEDVEPITDALGLRLRLRRGAP